MTVMLQASRYPERADYLAAHDRLLERLEAIPGVEAAGSIRYLPMHGVGEDTPWELPGASGGENSERRTAEVLQATPGLFRALGVPLLHGRAVSEGDVASAPLALVVNATFARQAFGSEDAVGRQVRIDGLDGSIVGVVGDVHQRRLETAPTPTIYVPLKQIPRRAMTFVLRADGDPLALAAAARQAVHDVDPGQAITEVAPLDAVVSESLARPRFFTLLLSSFAALAILLAAVGIYGVLAFTVRQRTREIGVRMALGADRRDTLRLVVWQGLRPASLGVAVGLLSAVPLTRVMRSLLFGVRPLDPITYGTVVALLFAVAIVACWIPGRRATRLDPTEALRSE